MTRRGFLGAISALAALAAAPFAARVKPAQISSAPSVLPEGVSFHRYSVKQMWDENGNVTRIVEGTGRLTTARSWRHLKFPQPQSGFRRTSTTVAFRGNRHLEFCYNDIQIYRGASDA